MLSFSHATHFLILLMPLDFQHVNQWLHFQWVDLSTTVDESIQIGCNGQVCSSTDAHYTIHSCLWKKLPKPRITPTVDNAYCTLSLNCPKSFELFLFYSYFCCILFFLEGVVIASSVLNLAELMALRPDLTQLKKVLYFHENQLIYPVRKQQERDFQYGYNQILSWWEQWKQLLIET